MPSTVTLPPFAGSTEAELFDAILMGQVCDPDAVSEHEVHLSPLAREFIRLMLTKAEEDRPEAESLLSHPYLAEVEATGGALPTDVQARLAEIAERSALEHRTMCVAGQACVLLSGAEAARAAARGSVEQAVAGTRNALISANVALTSLVSIVEENASELGEGGKAVASAIGDAQADMDLMEAAGVPCPKLDGTALLALLGDVSARATDDAACKLHAPLADASYGLRTLVQAYGTEAAAARERAGL